MTSRRRRQSLRFRLAAAVITLFAFGLFGEAYARFLAPALPVWQARDPGDVIMVGHATRLWGMGAGQRQNGGATASINDLGLRGEKPRLPRPPGRERVMVTGDSSFFGHGVADDATPAVLLAARLRAKGFDADTVNAAVPGYSTEQTLLLMEEVGWALEPSLLVVCNVWSDYNFDHFRDQDLLATRQAFTDTFRGQSALFQLVAGWADRFRGGEGAHLVTWTQHSQWPETGVRRVPPRRYAENLDSLVRQAAARNVGVIFVQPTNRDMARGDLSGADVRSPYFEAQDSVAAWHGLRVVDTLDAFTVAGVAAGSDTLFLDDLHPSAAGNAVLADTMMAGLVAADWPMARQVGRLEAFDASGIVDTAPDSRGASPGAMSPQVNLFPGGATGLSRASTSAPKPAQAASAAGSVDGAAWTLSGTVRAPPAPVEVTARTLGDERIATVVLRGQTEFRFDIPAGNPRVRVEAMSADGRIAVVAASGGGDLALVIGE